MIALISSSCITLRSALLILGVSIGIIELASDDRYRDKHSIYNHLEPGNHPWNRTDDRRRTYRANRAGRHRFYYYIDKSRIVAGSISYT